MKRQHHPERTCLGCGAKDDQKALLRVVARGSGMLQLDSLGKGRGGYLHKAEGCWEAFLKKKASIEPSIWQSVGRLGKN